MATCDKEAIFEEHQIRLNTQKKGEKQLKNIRKSNPSDSDQHPKNQNHLHTFIILTTDRPIAGKAQACIPHSHGMHKLLQQILEHREGMDSKFRQPHV